MKSMVISRFGDIDVFEEALLPIPTVIPGHVLIKVIATSVNPFAEKLAISKQLGADITINYKKTDVRSYVQDYTNNTGFDVIFDTVGGENLSECFIAAALFGKVVSILAVGSHDLTPAFLKGLTIHTVMQPLPLITGVRRLHYGEILSKIAALIDQGIIRPLIDEKKFTINQVGAAHAYLESGQAIGKVVLSHM